MRRSTSIFLCCLLSFPFSAQAAGSVKTYKAFSTHSLKNLIVAQEDTLVVEPGVVIAIAPGGKVEIAGSVLMLGTETSPVVITGNWRGALFSSSATVQLVHVQFKHFEGPVRIATSQFTARGLLLEDAIANTLIFSGSNGAGYQLSNLVFSNVLRGAAMQSAGIVVESTDTSLEVFGAAFLGSYPTTAKVGLYLEHGYRNVGAHGFSNDRGCAFVTTRVENHMVYTYELLGSGCHVDAPVLFIPGYGTSINIAKLTKPTPLPAELDGWSFSRVISSSYKYLLDAFSRNHIPASVAYYDWRLPAEEIVVQYIIPAIQKLKQQTGTGIITIVGHSFGGILARQYIQSNQYSGDVAAVFTLGTPHQGSPKAYSVWEGGVVPADWKILLQLIRYYQYKEKRNETPAAAIRRYFPSVRQLLPIYPFLKQDGLLRALQNQQNTFLQGLAAAETTNARLVPVTAFYSQSEPTITTLNVGNVQPGSSWEDGYVTSSTSVEQAGDGTVPAQGAQLSGAVMLTSSGEHADLPRKSAQKLIEALRPTQSYVAPEDRGIRQSKDTVWFVADCPVSLRVIAQDGTTYTDANPADGESFVTKDLAWLIIPKQAGEYQFSITATQATEARFWVDDGPIQTVVLSKGESVKYTAVEKLLPDQQQLGKPQSAATSTVNVVTFPKLVSLLLVSLRSQSLRNQLTASQALYQHLMQQFRLQLENSR